MSAGLSLVMSSKRSSNIFNLSSFTFTAVLNLSRHWHMRCQGMKGILMKAAWDQWLEQKVYAKQIERNRSV